MRHKYETQGIVLSRVPLGEANTLITLLTADVGLIRARAQGLRRPGAKLAPALATFAESEVVLVRGKEQWRLSGAVLREQWQKKLSYAARVRAGRVSQLLLRLVAGEMRDQRLLPLVKDFFSALSFLPEEVGESTEMLAALRLLSLLGLDAGGHAYDNSAFTPELLAEISKDRRTYIARINHGIEASGL